MPEFACKAAAVPFTTQQPSFPLHSAGRRCIRHALAYSASKLTLPLLVEPVMQPLPFLQKLADLHQREAGDSAGKLNLQREAGYLPFKARLRHSPACSAG